MFCYKGEWFVVPPPQNTRQSQQVTWAFARGESMNKAMQNWYTKERKIASLLYPLQDKEEKCSETTGGKRSTLR